MAKVRRLRWAILRRWFRAELDQTFWEGADWGWQQRQWGEKATDRMAEGRGAGYPGGS